MMRQLVIWMSIFAFAQGLLSEQPNPSKASSLAKQQEETTLRRQRNELFSSKTRYISQAEHAWQKSWLFPPSVTSRAHHFQCPSI